jgi:hypothetical protein
MFDAPNSLAAPRARALSLMPILILSFAGCGSASDEPPAQQPPAADELTFETSEFVIPAGQEKYMCYTTRLADGVTLDRFKYTAQPGIHHIVMARTLVPESETPTECDALFKSTWIPIFGAGTGSADVSTPEGVGFKLPAKSQLLIQLHLLNAGATELRGSAKFVMHKNTDPSVIGAGLYAFGTQAIDLPSKQQTVVTNDCALERDVDTFAVFPHMHKLGQSIEFWSGKDAATMTKQFSLDSWSFGDQAFYPLKMNLKTGDMTRVRCTYDNTTDKAVQYGESSLDEMCYFVTYVTPDNGLDGCVHTGP